MEQAHTEETTGSEVKSNSDKIASLNSGHDNSEINAKERLLNLNDASQLAGVSASTLMRFAEAGYFKIFNNGSEIKFSDAEIAQVFGVTFNYSKIGSLAPEAANFGKNTDSSKNTVSLNSKNLQNSGTKEDSEKADPGSTSPTADKLKDSNTEYKTLASQIEVINEIPSGQADLQQNELENPQASEPLEPFKKVLQLQEELLAQKNTVIADLIKERDWLRTRLEKMEEKSERDQMLLMVESQKVKTLISSDSDSQKKLGSSNAGFINKALAWFK